MRLIENTISRLGIGEPVSRHNLTVFPLLGDSLPQPDYTTLRRALGEKTARVTEVSDGGSVPMMRLRNDAPRPVLVVEGEELIGSKQNRTANVTVLVPGRKTVDIPVTCVEAGRWRYDSNQSSTSDQFHFYAGRKSKMASVFSSLRATGQAAADQGEVWRSIDRKARRTRVSSATSAMSDVFDAHRDRVDDYVAAFETRAGQTGAAFAIGGRIEGIELFDSVTTFGDYLPKLVRSYAIDAMETAGNATAAPGPGSVRTFLDALARAEVETFNTVGLGTQVRMRTSELLAGGLTLDTRVVHMAAFASEDTSAANDDGGREGSGLLSRLRLRRRARGG